MAESADRGKKSLIVMVVTFLLMGGGVFVFLIWNGLQDMQDVKFRSYGSGIAGRATLPILKYFGFVDAETPEGKIRDERALKIEEALNSGGQAAAAAASSVSPSSSARAPSRGYSGGGSGAASRLGASLSGAGALGAGGGSKSFSSFSGPGDSGALNLSGGSGPGGGGAVKGGKTMDALMASRGHLAAATNTNSALAARSKWDQGFGMKHAGAGGGGQLSSYNKAAASLDHIESGEVSSLKIGDPTTLDVPDVGKPKAVKEGETAADKAKDAMKKNMADQIGKSLLGNIGGGGDSAGGGGGGTSRDLPPDVRQYIDENLVLSDELDVDKEYDYKVKKCAADCPEGVQQGQDYYHITFRGEHGTEDIKNDCAVYQLEGGGYESSCF